MYIHVHVHVAIFQLLLLLQLYIATSDGHMPLMVQASTRTHTPQTKREFTKQYFVLSFAVMHLCYAPLPPNRAIVEQGGGLANKTSIKLSK